MSSPPNDAAALLAQGQAAEAAGDTATARAAYLGSLTAEPSFGAIFGYVKTAWSNDPDGCLDLLRKASGHTPETRAMLGAFRLQYEELGHRRRRGLMEYHSHSIDDVLFRFAITELEAYGAAATELGSAEQVAVAAYCAGDGSQLERHALQLYQSGNRSIWSLIRFSADHFGQIANNDPAVGLPSVTTDRVAEGDGPVVWLSCSEDYLVFARPMLASLQLAAPGVSAHLHVMDPRGDPKMVLNALPQPDASVGLSWEHANGNRNYYHAIRFIRLWQWMTTQRRPAWLMDVDALINFQPGEMFKRLERADVAFRARPARIEPWNQFNASVVGFSMSERSLDYLKLVANTIARFHKFGRLAWGIDQLAMLGAYHVIKPTVGCLNDREVDYSYRSDGVVWCNSSARKFQHLKGKPDPERQAYVDLFNRYAAQIKS